MVKMSLVNMPDNTNVIGKYANMVKMPMVKRPDSNNASGKKAKW